MELSFLFRDREAQEQARELVMNDSCDFRLSPKYQIYYRFFRPIMPIAIRQLLQRNKNVEVTDQWYLPEEFLNSMTASLGASDQQIATVHPWPSGADFAFVLTHDVETADGMRHIERIAALEESLGFRSSWNLVPYKYKIDIGLIKDLQSRGFEIGIHGYNHDGQLYSSRRTFERRATGINAALEKYSAVGFRSPMVHRNLDWLQQLNIEYDSSCFDIDPFQAAPGGIGSLWPFVAGRFVELPYTLPQDHTLFIGLGERDDRIWREKLDFIIRHQGMALMLTHPDYMTGRHETDIYTRFLDHVKTIGGFWHATPMELSRWWREREQIVEFGLPGNATSDDDHANDDRFIAAELKLGTDSFEFVSR